jgi:hypothetical protein
MLRQFTTFFATSGSLVKEQYLACYQQKALHIKAISVKILIYIEKK